MTDAPLIEPLLLSWTTGATIDVYKGVDMYVRVSEEFLRFQRTGRRTGLLAQTVSHPKYDKAVPEASLPEQWKNEWQVHVAPRKGREG